MACDSNIDDSEIAKINEIIKKDSILKDIR